MKTTSFELSKKITNLIGEKKTSILGYIDEDEELYPHKFDCKNGEGYRPYTLDELLEMLPCEFSNTNYVLSISGKLPESYYEIGYYLEEDGSLSLLKKDCLHIVLHKNPAEAAGQLLCWCVENGYVEVDKINGESNNENN